MAINLAGIAAAVAAEIPLIIEDGIEREILGKPSFIADGTPESLPGQIGQGAARAACRQYAAGNSGLTGQAAVNAETACRPYLNNIYPPTAPTVKTPFNGGQCPGVNYRVTWAWSAGSFNSGPQTADRTGPLSFDRSGTGSLPCGGGETYNVLVLREGTGNNPVSIYAGCGAALTSFNVSRLDGQPDNCGSPPPEITQPAPNPDPIGNPFRFNPIPGIDLPIDVTINPDGTINVDIGTGPINVDAFNGDGGGGGAGDGGGGGGGAPPGDVGQPGGAEATGDGGEAEGEAPPGQVLVGLRVVLTAFPPSRTKLTDEVFRGAYYAYMGVPGLLDLDPAGSAVTLDQFIFAEQPNLTAWRLRANRGYNATVTPYYRIPE